MDGVEGERLHLDTGSETLSVVCHGDVVLSENEENFSDDWTAATFSRDGGTSSWATGTILNSGSTSVSADASLP